MVTEAYIPNSTRHWEISTKFWIKEITIHVFVFYFSNKWLHLFNPTFKLKHALNSHPSIHLPAQLSFLRGLMLSCNQSIIQPHNQYIDFSSVKTCSKFSFICPFVCLFVCPFVCSLICFFVCSFIHSSIHLSVLPFFLKGLHRS